MFKILSCVVSIFSSTIFQVFAEQSEYSTNNVALEYAHDLSKHVPEAGTFLGLTEYASRVGFIEENQDDIERTFNEKWIGICETKIQDYLKSFSVDQLEKMPLPLHEAYVELLHLKRKCEANIAVLNMNEKYHRLTVPNSYFNCMFDAIDPVMYLFVQTFLVLQERGTTAAAQRFSLYVNGDENNLPFIQGVQHYLDVKIEKYTDDEKTILYPAKNQVSKMISQAHLLKKIAPVVLTGVWNALWTTTTFWKQVNEYVSFLEQKILPNCLDDKTLPEELYVAYMNLQGVYVNPQTLIENALEDYEKAQREFSELALSFGKIYHIEGNNLNDIFNGCKKNTMRRSAAEALELYKNDADDFESTIKNHDLFDLPEHKMRIRLSGMLEGVVIPASRCTPPRVFNNDGTHRPELVLAKWKIYGNDFSSLFLVPHEGRPGHELHFSSILDQKQNYLRTSLIFDFATIEGWACYAQDIVSSYHLTVDSSCNLINDKKNSGTEVRQSMTKISNWDFRRNIALKAALCVQLILGQKTAAEVRNTLMTELGSSEVEADASIDRFSGGLGLGQSVCYYYGQKRLLDFKDQMSQQLGDRFKLKDFHNAVLSYGFLSVDLSKPLIQRKLIEKNGNNNNWD